MAAQSLARSSGSSASGSAITRGEPGRRSRKHSPLRRKLRRQVPSTIFSRPTNSPYGAFVMKAMPPPIFTWPVRRARRTSQWPGYSGSAGRRYHSLHDATYTSPGLASRPPRGRGPFSSSARRHRSGAADGSPSNMAGVPSSSSASGASARYADCSPDGSPGTGTPRSPIASAPRSHATAG